jgi:putative addiction module component (TIGR02574 family)
MTEVTDELKTRLSQLSARERAELAHFLLRSLEEGADAGTESAWDAELARRMDEIETGKVFGEPAEKVFVELREKYS